MILAHCWTLEFLIGRDLQFATALPQPSPAPGVASGPGDQGHLPHQLRQARRTWASHLCFLDTRWFFGFTESLCLAALLSRRAMARGMASRLTLSMVPAEEKCRFGREGLTGTTCGTDSDSKVSADRNTTNRESHNNGSAHWVLLAQPSPRDVVSMRVNVSPQHRILQRTASSHLVSEVGGSQGFL